MHTISYLQRRMEYREALLHALRPPVEKYSQRERDPEAIRNAGVELSNVSESIKRTGVVVFHCGNVEVGKVNESEALRLAIISNPILGSQYSGHEILPDREAFEQVKKHYANRAQFRRFESAQSVHRYRDLPVASIKGLEIFAAGVHPNMSGDRVDGDRFTIADLDEMVEAFNKVGFSPPIKAGHAGGQESEAKAREVFGAPALGYVERVYRVGEKLLADFKDIPRKFADLIKAGAYKRVSSEIYYDYIGGSGRKFHRVLKAVSFLGADIPAITNLKAVENLYRRRNDGNDFRVY